MPFKLKGTTGATPEWVPSLWPSRFRGRMLSGQAIDGMQSGAFKASEKTPDVYVYEYEWDTLPKEDLDAFETFRTHTDIRHSLKDVAVYDYLNLPASPTTVRILPDNVVQESDIGTLRDGLVIRLVKV